MALLVFARAGGEQAAQQALSQLADSGSFVLRAVSLELGLSTAQAAVYMPSAAATARNEDAADPLAESAYIPLAEPNDNPVLDAADKAATITINNETSYEVDVAACLASDTAIHVSGDGPQVLIMHTHATESFEPYDTDTYDTRHTWRTTDNTQNIVAAGEVMAEAIRSYGIEVLHDETQHDYPSYNGSYERSAVTVQDYLEKYPSIKVVLDVHRDAVQRDTTLVKPVTEIDGRKAAQLMIIAGCDDGTMDMPNWSKNFRFAAGMQDAIESRYPSLTRPVFFCYRKYNQDLTTGSLLIEIGSHGNTLEEVLYTAQLAGDAIGSYLQGLRAAGE